MIKFLRFLMKTGTLCSTALPWMGIPIYSMW